MYFSKEYPGGTSVAWGNTVDRQLGRLPTAVREKFQAWVTVVSLAGIRAVRRTPGFHDEPLKGKRHGQRSVRLNRAYRVIYVEHEERVHLVEVIEVHKHDY